MASLRKYICTFQVTLAPAVLIEQINLHSPKITRKGYKILEKSSKNRPLGLSWGPFWSLLGSILDTCSQKAGFWRLWKRPGRPKQPTWLQLGGPRPSKTQSKTWKIDVEKQYVFYIDFFVVWTSFGQGFWEVFWTKKLCKKGKGHLCEKSTKHCVGARILRFSHCNIWQNSLENCTKNVCFWEYRFLIDLGGFRDGFGRPKSLIFFCARFFDQNRYTIEVRKKNTKLAPLAGGRPPPREAEPFVS